MVNIEKYLIETNAMEAFGFGGINIKEFHQCDVEFHLPGGNVKRFSNFDSAIKASGEYQKYSQALKIFGKHAKQNLHNAERAFCKYATNRANKDMAHLPFKKYSDIPGFAIKHIRVSLLFNEKTRAPGDLFNIVISGSYDVDHEHGWSMAFLADGTRAARFGQAMDDYYMDDFPNPY